MENRETGRELKSSLILTLKSLARELDLAVSKSKVFAENLKAAKGAMKAQQWSKRRMKGCKECSEMAQRGLKGDTKGTKEP